MLEFFRQHIGGGILGIAIVALLALAFAFSFGAQSKGWGEGAEERFAATVNGEDISETVLRYAFNLSGGKSLDRQGSDSLALQQTLLEGLIERQLLLDLAKEEGISASQDEAEERIIKSEIFMTQSMDVIARQIESNMFLSPALVSRILVSGAHQVRQSFINDDDKFDLESYKKFVRYYLQMPEEAFVEQQRLEIVAERMRQLIVSPVRVSEDEVRAEYEREHDTATIKYIRFLPSKFADSLTPLAEELDTWAKEHADEIKKYYESNKFRYTNLEKMVRARHILIKVAEDASEAQRKEARAKIDELLNRVKSGESFAELAKENSEDPGSGSKGGDLGYTPRGRMVPEFEKAMFETAPGQITDVVETQYGYHIIKVLDVREGNVSLEDATPEIAEKLYREKRGEEEAKTLAEQMLKKAKNGAELESLLPGETKRDLLGLKTTTSQPFNRTSKRVPGVGEVPEIITAAFGSNPDAVKPMVVESGGSYFLVRILERHQPTDEEYQKLREQIEGKLLSLKQGEWLIASINQMKKGAEEKGKIARYFDQMAFTTRNRSDKRQKEEEKTKDLKKAADNPKPSKSAPASADTTGAQKDNAEAEDDGDNEENENE